MLLVLLHWTVTLDMYYMLLLITFLEGEFYIFVSNLAIVYHVHSFVFHRDNIIFPLSHISKKTLKDQEHVFIERTAVFRDGTTATAATRR